MSPSWRAGATGHSTLASLPTLRVGRLRRREGEIAGLTKRYGCKLLVWMEPHERMDEAIAREKQIKSGSRKDKLVLIERDNPLWNDLYETLNA